MNPTKSPLLGRILLFLLLLVGVVAAVVVGTVPSAASAEPLEQTVLLGDLESTYANLWQGSELTTADIRVKPGEIGHIRAQLCGPENSSCGALSADGGNVQSVKTGGVVRARLIAEDPHVWFSGPSAGEDQTMVHRTDKIEWEWPVRSDSPGMYSLDLSLTVLYLTTEISLATFTTKINLIVSGPGPLGIAVGVWRWLATSALGAALAGAAIAFFVEGTKHRRRTKKGKRGQLESDVVV